ncbi:MAG: hypothetical protein ACOCV1_02395 [Bacillota bacterium]
MASDQWNGIISSQSTRLEANWADSNIPGGTTNSQWSVDPSSIISYDNSSSPWKNMQNISLFCEFDSTTNIAPDDNDFDPDEAPGTDADPVEDAIITGNITAPNIFTATASTSSGTYGFLPNDPYGTFSSATDPQYVSDTTPYPTVYEVYNLQIKASTYNNGYYRISQYIPDTEEVTITNFELDSPFVRDETSVAASVYAFQFDTSIDHDIQTDLQTNASGKYRLIVTMHAWPSPLKDSILHKFEIVPYWLIRSRLNSTAVIPRWEFVCKCIVREISVSGSTFSGIWD